MDCLNRRSSPSYLDVRPHTTHCSRGDVAAPSRVAESSIPQNLDQSSSLAPTRSRQTPPFLLQPVAGTKPKLLPEVMSSLPHGSIHRNDVQRPSTAMGVAETQLRRGWAELSGSPIYYSSHTPPLEDETKEWDKVQASMHLNQRREEALGTRSGTPNPNFCTEDPAWLKTLTLQSRRREFLGAHSGTPWSSFVSGHSDSSAENDTCVQVAQLESMASSSSGSWLHYYYSIESLNSASPAVNETLGWATLPSVQYNLGTEPWSPVDPLYTTDPWDWNTRTEQHPAHVHLQASTLCHKVFPSSAYVAMSPPETHRAGVSHPDERRPRSQTLQHIKTTAPPKGGVHRNNIPGKRISPRISKKLEKKNAMAGGGSSPEVAQGGKNRQVSWSDESNVGPAVESFELQRSALLGTRHGSPRRAGDEILLERASTGGFRRLVGGSVKRTFA